MDQQLLFEELDWHLLEDPQPSIYLRSPDTDGRLRKTQPFDQLAGLQEIEQSPVFHPEGNVWEHTLLVVDQAAHSRHLSQNPRVFMWAALLHDIGKIPTTKIRRGRITAYDHDREGAKMAVRFLRELTEDEDFIEGVRRLIRWHMHSLYVNKRLPFAHVDQMLSEVPLQEIALFSLCDRCGRGDMDAATQLQEIAGVQSFVEQCQPEEGHDR